jgi:hypothetical protein
MVVEGAQDAKTTHQYDRNHHAMLVVSSVSHLF